MDTLWFGGIRNRQFLDKSGTRRDLRAVATEQIGKIVVDSLDSAIVRVHPDSTDVLRNGSQVVDKSCGGWSTEIHMVAANARTTITFALSAGQASARAGCELLAA